MSPTVRPSVYGGGSRRSQALMAEGLPQALLEFVGLCIPSFQAAELLVLLAGNFDRSFTEQEIVTAVRPALISVSAVGAYACGTGSVGVRRLMLDVLNGDASLSIRNDEVEESWRIVTPILNAWTESRVPLIGYPAGSAGPRPENAR